MLRIKEICREKGMSQVELAKRLGVSPSAINQNLTGNPRLDRLEEIASALGVHISELFERTPTAISGYIELNGEVKKVSSVQDLEKVLDTARKQER